MLPIHPKSKKVSGFYFSAKEFWHKVLQYKYVNNENLNNWGQEGIYKAEYIHDK